MTIALSHGGPTIYAGISPEEVLVGTARGVARIRRGAQGWELVETTLPEQHISALLVESKSGYVFAGAYGDGSLRRSRDGGHTYELANKGITETEIFSLEAVERDGNVRLFAGTEPARLFVSDDLGNTWTELAGLRDVSTVGSWSFPAPPHVGHAKHITFDPHNPETMYVSIEVGGLLRSDDAGQTWRDVPGMYEDVHRLVINPADPQRQYVTGGNGLYGSEDGGATWGHWTTREHALGGYPDQLLFDPRNPEVMFIASAHEGPGSWRTSHFAGCRISRSRDGGHSWEVLTNGLPDRMQGNVEAMALATGTGAASIFAATTAGEVFASEDDGSTWSCVVSGLAPISKGGHYRNLMTETATATATA